MLLGDSIFDNAAYTRGEPDVVSHLRRLLPPPSTATLLAVDGATTRGLPQQLSRLPREATHLVVSIGGNDALGHADLLRMPAASTAHALSLLADRVEAFEADYRAALAPVVAVGKPTVLCTIYNGNLPAQEARVARTALAAFNDVILRVAAERQLPVVELRIICTEPRDYANPIEPSGTGGEKIAQAIVRAVTTSHLSV